MQRFSKGIHIAVDDLREMVVSGIAHPVPQWTAETGLQFALARASAVQMALNYAAAGFAVAIDDVISEDTYLQDYAPHFAQQKPQKVLLLPSLETVLERNATRTNKNFDHSILEGVIGRLYGEFAEMDKGDWVVVDSSQQTLAQTLDSILSATK